MNEHARHEDTDINVRAILGVGAGVIVAGIVIAALVWSLFAYLSNREGSEPCRSSRSPPASSSVCRRSRGCKPTRAKISARSGRPKTRPCRVTGGSTGTPAW